MDKFNLLKVFRQSIITHLQNGEQARKLSFTMAEILLSLTIIGVVAAITLPSLTGNINERTWEAKRKAFYARMSQAIALMGNLNGYGISATESETASNAAKTFVRQGLAKVLKINNICDYEHLNDCNLTNTIKNANNSTMSLPVTMYQLNPQFSYYLTGAGPILKNTYATAFETANGDSVLAFYNPYCTTKDVRYETLSTANETGFTTRQYICLNLIFDTNGKKGPNTTGKDIGIMTVLYATDASVTMALPSNRAINPTDFYTAMNYCKDQGVNLPTIDEAISYYSSIYLYGNDTPTSLIWTKTTDSTNNNNALAIGGHVSAFYSRNKTSGRASVKCIK